MECAPAYKKAGAFFNILFFFNEITTKIFTPSIKAIAIMHNLFYQFLFLPFPLQGDDYNQI